MVLKSDKGWLEKVMRVCQVQFMIFHLEELKDRKFICMPKLTQLIKSRKRMYQAREIMTFRTLKTQDIIGALHFLLELVKEQIWLEVKRAK